MEDILRTLVAYRSITTNIDENRKLQQYVADYLSERGMHVKWFESNGQPSFVATVIPDKKDVTVMLAAHSDVVFAPDELFTLQKKDGAYIGRGVLDMKCAIAAYMKAVDILKDNLQDYDFGVMITSDEEIAGRDGVNGSLHLIGEGYLPKMLILPDGGQDWQLETTSNGYMHISLATSGKAAHSSRPWEGDNAAFKMIKALNDIVDRFKDHGRETDTLNIGTIHTEGPINRIPDNARAEVSIRITKLGGAQRWERIFNDICTQHQVKMIIRSAWDPVYNSIENPYVKRYAELTEEVTGVKVVGSRSYAGSDARFFGELEVPYANAYPRGNGHHSDHEWLAEESLEQLGMIVTRYLQEMARTRP